MKKAAMLAGGVLLAGVAALSVFGKSASPDEKAYSMARYMLRQHIERSLGADPDNFRISEQKAATVISEGRSTWLVRGEYLPPIGTRRIPWEMRVYGPFDGDNWRNCQLTIDGEVATRVGAAVPC